MCDLGQILWKYMCSSHGAYMQMGPSFQQNLTFQATWKRNINVRMNSGLPCPTLSEQLFVLLM